MTPEQKRRRIKAGDRFGRLTVVEKDGPRKWRCRCKCGNERSVFTGNLTRGFTVSCGCHNQEMRRKSNITHGLRSQPEYGIWNGIKQRCLNPNRKAYPEYGGRGITICERWKNDFSAFYEDMGPRPSPKHSVDRIDVNGNYEPGNCRWVLDDIQARNQRGKGSSSGVKGVYPNTSGWIARIRIDGKLINLGTFDTVEAAAEERRKAELKYWGLES